ncbi:hypothetical protein MJM43_28935, partial [Salmonella enterica subsp. enterica serovar Montevideo]|nr:hypothetical protein [Salmonella enterica subsp. enterica serovar Montevideo]
GVGLLLAGCATINTLMAAVPRIIYGMALDGALPRFLTWLHPRGVMVYQETYHEAIYAQHHLKGKKQDFFWRLETPDRLGRAGID